MQLAKSVSALAVIGLILSGCAPKGSSTQSPAQADATPAVEPEAAAQASEPAAAPEQKAPAQPATVAATVALPTAALLSSGASCPNGAKAGESWKVDCNTCSCSETGEVQCTMKACIAPDAKEEGNRCPDGRQVGDTWNEACNMCRCDEEGYPVCTLKACLDGAQ